MELDKVAADAMTKAGTALVLDDPFYGYLFLRMNIIQDPSVQTACTNGKEIRYSPKFIKDMRISQIKGLLKHEIMHVAHMHHLRRHDRDPAKWNLAGDYVINALLMESNTDLPENGAFDINYANFSTEHVYNLLPDVPPGEGPFWGFGGVADSPDMGEGGVSVEQLEADVKLDVLQAYNTAKIMGKIPAGMDRLVGDIQESKLPWRRLLARFFRATAKDDVSWNRPNRRFLAHDIYLPSAHSEALGPLVIGVDTSGSIAKAELSMFFGCINGILRQTKPEAVHVVYCDARVGNVEVFYPRQYPLKLANFHPKGGGGTNFEPVFDYVAENRLNPVALLYLTDMYGNFPDVAPKYPTLWCATSDLLAPFGKVIRLS